ncbi:hypothetical protein CARUB_v10025532mg [Capsella rubella]|uniref:Uncharacterized protein n=1 Tax=Capsella rubella TaxID=81985 RepID=R0HYT8_9BRAS|nr:hypothetical protein CARUB_v10025532mg [Capsella rubella]
MKLTLKWLLMLLFVLSHHHHADSSSIVKFLPGFEGPLPFELETGYIGIGEEEEAQLFYYFVKSENNPEEDPLLLWLEGGPGVSSITAFVLENGPVAFKSEVYNGSVPSLVSTTYSWTKVANIIYLDQPIGAGFSYSKTPLGKNNDTNAVNMIHEFLQKWLSKHPQYFSNPFYVTGASYGGMIVPAVVNKISKGNYICCNPPINLQGYVLGNPSLKRFCKGSYFNVDPSNTKCLKLVEEYYKCTENVNTHQILVPNCDNTNTENISPDCIYYVYHLLERWSNKDSVRKALHIHKGTKGEWVRFNHSVPYERTIKSSIPYHMSNSINGYRSLIFTGDHDMVLPSFATQAWIKSLNYSIAHEWKPWMVNDQNAGYTRTYSNKMTFATIKGGGHTPEYLPKKTSILFQRWISGQPL